MEWSAKLVSDWKEAEVKRFKQVASSVNSSVPAPIKRRKPDPGVLKLNVDAAVKLGTSSFSIGLMLRDHASVCISGRTVCRSMVNSVFEAEACAVLEGLQWLCSMGHDKSHY